MNKINNKINGNRFIPVDSEEKTALELIKKVIDKSNEVVEQVNTFEIGNKGIKETVIKLDKKVEELKSFVDKLPAIDASAEVVDARCGKDTLGEFNREISSQLDKKASSLIENSAKTKQYVDIDFINNVVKIQYKYFNTEDRIIELSKCGLNNLFSFSKIYKNNKSTDTIYPSGNLNDLILVQEFDTDIIGPIMFEVLQNADTDKTSPISAFTGGWHGYNGNQTGSPTARQGSIDYKIDGKIITKNFKGYCDAITIELKQYIQACNTRKLDGSGREALEQRVYLLFKEGKCEVHIRLIPLENVRFSTYYGLQTASSGDYANSPMVHFFNGEAKTRQAGQNGVTSGLKPSYPNVDRISIRNATNDDIVIWIDNTYGIGNRQYVDDASPLAFWSGYKSYFRLITPSASFTKNKGQAIEFHGGLAWVKGTQSNCDSFIELLKNGRIWKVADFLNAKTETKYPNTNELFLSNSIEELKKDTTITGFNNFFYCYSIISNGYGEYWFRFKD